MPDDLIESRTIFVGQSVDIRMDIIDIGTSRGDWDIVEEREGRTRSFPLAAKSYHGWAHIETRGWAQKSRPLAYARGSCRFRCSAARSRNARSEGDRLLWLG